MIDVLFFSIQGAESLSANLGDPQNVIIPWKEDIFASSKFPNTKYARIFSKIQLKFLCQDKFMSEQKSLSVTEISSEAK